MLFKFQAVTIKPHLLMVMHAQNLILEDAGAWHPFELFLALCLSHEGQSRTEVRGCCWVAVCRGNGVRWVMGLPVSIMSRDLGSWRQWHVKAVWLCRPFRAHLWACRGKCQNPGWVGFGYLLEGERLGRARSDDFSHHKILSDPETTLLISRSLCSRWRLSIEA